MHRIASDLMSQKRVSIWIAIATSAILLIPLIAMRFTTEVNWDETDFIIMGSLLFGMAGLFVLVSRRLAAKQRVFVGGLFVLAFLYVWAELAVGVFTNLRT